MTNDSPRENPVAIVETLHPNLGTSALACTFLELLIADLMFLRKVPISRWSHTVVAEAVQVNIVFHNTLFFSQRFTWKEEREAAIRNKFIFIYICLSVPGHNGSSQTMHRSSTLAQYNGVSPKVAMLGGDIRLNAFIKCTNAFVRDWLPRQGALRY